MQLLQLRTKTMPETVVTARRQQLLLFLEKHVLSNTLCSPYNIRLSGDELPSLILFLRSHFVHSPVVHRFNQCTLFMYITNFELI